MAGNETIGILHSDDVAELHDALTTAIDCAPGLYFIVAAVYEGDEPADFIVETANQAACEALGLTVEDARGQSVNEIYPFPDKEVALRDKLAEAVTLQQPQAFNLGDSPFDQDGPHMELLARCIPHGSRVFLSVTPFPKARAPGQAVAAAHFDNAFNASPCGMAVVTLNGGLIERINGPMGQILGIESAQARGCFLEDFLLDSDQWQFVMALQKLARDPGASQRLQIGLTGADEETRFVDVTMTSFENNRTVVQALDKSDQIRRMRLAEERARDFELLAESMSEVVLRVDTSGVVKWASPSFSKLVGRPPREAVNQSILHFVDPDFSRAAYAAISSAATGREVKDFLVRLATQDGDSRWAQASARPIRTPTGGIDAVVLTFRDVDAELKTREKLKELTLRDPLSGLGTREAMVTRLTEELQTPGAEVSVIEMHIDRLGRLNDAISYSGGDQVITTVAERLKAAVGARGDAFRTGAGDFGIILRETATISQALVIAERLRMGCGQPMSIGDLQYTPSLSVGVAFARDTDVNRLLYDSNRAMRTAKLRGRNQTALADDRGGLEATRWLVDEAELNDALREGRYNAYFQPIVTLSDDALAGFEVLVRCQQPDGRATLPPGQMAVAESTGLIKDIDRLVVGQALSFLRRLDAPHFISVNVSVRSLADPSYLPWVESSVRDAGLEPGRIRLEVTETTVLALPPSVRSAMERLAEAGFSWYMDDFGTGYSSLSSLRDLPMGGLKLDRSFTSVLVANRNRVQNLTKGMVHLAAEMGLSTVAEGVETREEADLLASQGWQYGQGWLFGRAMSAEDALRLSASSEAVVATPGAE